MAELRSPFDLSGKHVLINGAAGGIGSATAILCASLGAQLTLTDIIDSAHLAERVSPAGRKVAHYQVDASDRRNVEALRQNVGPVDALVDVAGFCPFDDWTAPDWDEAFDRVLDVNVRGPINMVRAFMPAMIERKAGRIVLVGSIAGRMGGLRASAHYSASKGAVHTLVRWFAQRATPHGVMIKAVAPGATDTGMIAGGNYDVSGFPQKRLLRPEEIAAPIVFLCSEGASGIAGVVLDANGGVHFS
jgi:3-oxoacyl-[acyl-carrier protein] reductase